MLAASCSTGTIKVRQSNWRNAHHGNPTRHDRYNRVKGTRSPWIHRREKRQTIRRNSRRIERQPAFSIVSPSPPRLRPSEVCQRGPPSPGSHCCATARIEKPSGKRSFAALENYSCRMEKADLRNALDVRNTLQRLMLTWRCTDCKVLAASAACAEIPNVRRYRHLDRSLQAVKFW